MPSMSRICAFVICLFTAACGGGDAGASNAQGMGNIWVLSEGLLHAVDPDGNPATDDSVDVINLSLGTTRRTELLEDILERVTCGDDFDADDDADEDVVRCAASGGAVVVSTAGNSGDETPHFPAAEVHDGALAVAANGEAGALAAFSTRGDWVDVCAPGELLYGAVWVVDRGRVVEAGSPDDLLRGDGPAVRHFKPRSAA